MILSSSYYSTFLYILYHILGRIRDPWFLVNTVFSCFHREKHTGYLTHENFRIIARYFCVSRRKCMTLNKWYIDIITTDEHESISSLPVEDRNITNFSIQDYNIHMIHYWLYHHKFLIIPRFHHHRSEQAKNMLHHYIEHRAALIRH